MSPLSQDVLEAAVAALARRPSEDAEAARRRRDDARAVAVAVLARLGGARGLPGIVPFRTQVAQKLLAMADELDDERG